MDVQHSVNGNISPISQNITDNTAKPSFFTRFRSSNAAVLFVVSLALFTDMLVYGIIIPILPAILRSIGVSLENETLYSTILFATFSLGLFIATPVFGVYSDRTGNRLAPMLLGLAGLSIATLIFCFSSSFTALLIARFLQGIAGAATWVVGLALVADTFPIHKLGASLGFVMSFHTVGFICGPLISGYAATYISLRSPFYICALFAALDFLSRLILKSPKNIKIKTAPSDIAAPADLAIVSNSSSLMKQFFSSEIISFLSHKEILLLCFGTVLLNASIAIIEALIAEYLERTFNLSLSECSNTFLFFVLPNVFFSTLVGKLSDRVSRSRLIIIGTIMHSLASPFISLARTVFQLNIAAVLFGITVSFMSTPIMPQMTFLLGSYGKSSTSFAKLYSLYLLACSLGMVVGPIFAGFIASYFSFHGVMLIFPISALCVFLPIYLYSTVHNERKRFRLANLSEHVPRPSFFRELFFPLPEPTYTRSTDEAASL